MRLSRYVKEESIGNPDYFCGREKELKELLEWVELIPKRGAKTRALMATRKMGKTAILDRLYNILFENSETAKSGQPIVIPFFFQVGEQDVSLMAFAESFYFSFLSQYLAFKCKQPKWTNRSLSFPKMLEVATEFELEEVLDELKAYEWLANQGNSHRIWEHACAAPHRIASQTGVFIVQIIDEFQYLNQNVFIDESCTHQIDLAPTWHKWSESRIAPQLISGSWVGWLIDIIRSQLTSRVTPVKLFPFPDRDALECVYNYAEFFDVDLSEESALAIQALSRNHPWYISTLIRSYYPNKDLSTKEGVEEILYYEMTHKQGEIYIHWMEYLQYAFEKTNGKRARAIVLFLSSNRHQEKTIQEIQAYLKSKELFLEERELEDKLKTLCRSDIIEEGSSASHYKGIPDDIFNQVVQTLFAYQIEQIDPKEIQEKIRTGNRKVMNSFMGKVLQDNKGPLLELLMIKYIKYRTGKKNTPPLRELIENAPENAKFVSYQTVGERHFNLPDGHHRQFDVFAKAADDQQPSLLIECKFHEKPVGPADVEYFAQKAEEMKQEVPNLIPIIYSASGFTGPVITKMKELQISWSNPKLWDVFAKRISPESKRSLFGG